MNSLEVKNLNFAYPDGKVALKNISFSVSENETVAIVGTNGAGKTTLLYSICGLHSTNGSVKIFDTKLTKHNLNKIRQKLSFVFQNPDNQLFMPTVFEDIAFGLNKLGFTKEEISKIVSQSLKAVGLINFENRSSHHLSFGEKKKVCLATALARNSQLMLLDEPTSEFAPGARKEFIKLINKINIPKIIISHDMDLIANMCNKTIILNNGEIMIFGNTEKLLADKQLMEKNGLEVPYCFK